MSATELHQCLACGSNDLRFRLDLGDQPPANLLLESPGDAFPTYPLRLMFCMACGHGQLSHAVNPNELFGKGYAYRSGVSRTSRELFQWFAACLSRAFPLTVNSILDIGCNDGTLLKYLRHEGFSDLWGIDSDSRLCQESSAYASVLQGFWPGHWHLPKCFDAIIAWNVLAHGPDPRNFLKTIRAQLIPNGLAFILCSKSDMLETGAFDSIYHEHVSYFNQASIALLADRAGLALHPHVFRVRMHGVSELYVLRRVEDAVPDLSNCGLDGGQFGLGLAPRQMQATSPDDYVHFANRAEAHRQAISALSPSPHPIVFVGAAAKAMVVLHSTNIRPRMVVDEAPSKIGRWIPNEARMIHPLSAIAKLDGKILAVLSAWNFAEELEAKVRQIRGDLPTEFLVYFPEKRRWS